MEDGERMNVKHMHYCEGTWRDGFVSDCEHADEHNVKLMQTDVKYKATVMRLSRVRNIPPKSQSG